MLRRSHYIALGLVVVLTLIILNLPARTTGQIKLAIGSFFLPLFGLSRASQQLSPATPDEGLLRTNKMLQIQLMRAAAIERENEQLRQFVGRARQPGWTIRYAKVLSRDPANWWRTVVIDLGTKDGMRVDMPVMTADGLVGRISVVFVTQSQVELIGNPGCKVSATVAKSGETGIISGSSGAFDTSLVPLSFFTSSSNVKPGQAVVTSGWGGVFPSGLVIGQIAEEARPVEFGLRAEARVKLAADLGGLQDVWVLVTQGNAEKAGAK